MLRDPTPAPGAMMLGSDDVRQGTTYGMFVGCAVYTVSAAGCPRTKPSPPTHRFGPVHCASSSTSRPNMDYADWSRPPAQPARQHHPRGIRTGLLGFTTGPLPGDAANKETA